MEITKKLFQFLFLAFLFSFEVELRHLDGIPPEPEVLGVVECTASFSNLPIEIEVYSNWSPLGAKRFLELVRDGYYDDSPLFRVVKGFIVQFGISLNTELENKWSQNTFPDDPNLGFPFERGYISYAGGGPNSRATQVFIAYSGKGTQHLGQVPHETPFGKVVSGMEVVEQFFDGDGEFSMDMKPWGKGPEQGRIKSEGRRFLRENYPKLSYISQCKVKEKNAGLDLGEKERRWKRWGALDRLEDDEIGIDRRRKGIYDRLDGVERTERKRKGSLDDDLHGHRNSFGDEDESSRRNRHHRTLIDDDDDFKRRGNDDDFLTREEREERRRKIHERMERRRRKKDHLLDID